MFLVKPKEINCKLCIFRETFRGNIKIYMFLMKHIAKRLEFICFLSNVYQNCLKLLVSSETCNQNNRDNVFLVKQVARVLKIMSFL